MIFDDVITKYKNKDNENRLIPQIHHILMKKYGWIPLEEFKNIPIPTLFSLLDMIKEDIDEEKKAIHNEKKYSH